MAQFSTLSQINELTSTIKSNMAVSLIGKTVSVVSTDSAGFETVKVGQVEQVSYNSGVPYLYVDGGFYQLTDVLDIGGAGTPTVDTSNQVTQPETEAETETDTVENV
jgi:hypothetical protein